MAFLAALTAFAVIPGAQAADEIGAVSDLHLVAFGTPPESARAPVFHRDTIVLNEELETVEEGALRVVFVDETVLDMGESARLVVDELVFDPAELTGNSLVNLVTGSFFYVSGKLPHKNVRLETPTAIIGVRGTEFAIEVEPDGATVVSVIDGEISFTSKVSGDLEVVSEGNNIEISATGQMSGIRRGFIRPKSVFIHKMSTLSAQKKFSKMSALIQQMQASGQTPPPALVEAAREMAALAAEVVSAPGDYGERAQRAARAVLSQLPAEVNVAEFVQSVNRQNRIERRFRLNRQKKVVLANYEYRRRPDGTIQRRESGDSAEQSGAQADSEQSARDRLRKRLRALIGAGASQKNLKKRITKKRAIQKCRKRPRRCRRLLGL